MQTEFDRRLGLRIGAPLALADVRAAIDALYATGRYHNIEVQAEPSGAGVELRILTEFNYFRQRREHRGRELPSLPAANKLRTATKLELGALFTENQMEPAASSLLERLRANGLYGSQVSYHFEYNPANEEAGIYFWRDSVQDPAPALTASICPALSPSRPTRWAESRAGGAAWSSCRCRDGVS